MAGMEGIRMWVSWKKNKSINQISVIKGLWYDQIFANMVKDK